MTFKESDRTAVPGEIEVVFVAVPMRDLSAADALVDDVRGASLDSRWCDVVSVGRKSSGDVRFHREPVRDASVGRRWSLSAGLAAAVFPSVAADQPSSRVVERAVLAVVSGRVAAAVGRAGLRAFGELLDTAPAAVIAVPPVGGEGPLLNLVPKGVGAIARSSVLDVAALERAVRDALATHPR